MKRLALATTLALAGCQAGPRPAGAVASPTDAAIYRNEVAIGMEPAHVLRSWGEPRARSQQATSAGVIDVWMYERANLSTVQTSNVLFANGKVVSIERGSYPKPAHSPAVWAPRRR
jgi:hypothetical protein